MLTEDVFVAISGPPLTSNTAIAKDVAIYHQTLQPSYGVRSTFKKSNTPPGGLAVSPSHVFAAQQDRGYIHVYSRLRGGQEAAIPVPEKVRCLTLAGDVLVAGTVEGRLLLWETLSGRLITTPPCHVQAVSCLQTTPLHILSGSDDSNVHVWSLPQLLALGTDADEPEPVRTLARHRAAVTALTVSSTASRDTSLCASASQDKTVVLWNYQTGVALRTLLFASVPTCLTWDPVARALYVATAETNEANANAKTDTETPVPSLFAVELFGEKPLLGVRGEATSTAASITTPFGTVPIDAGPTTCLSVSYDGTTLLSGHPRGQLLQWNLGDVATSSLPVELANLNAAVSNVVFVPPPALATRDGTAHLTSAQTVVRPTQVSRAHTVTVKFDEALPDPVQYTSFADLLHEPGFPGPLLDEAILALQQPTADATDADSALQKQNTELMEMLSQQQVLYEQALQRCAELEERA